jgi:hypothetical protein
MAERQRLRAARAIAAALRGEPDPPPFDGTGFCPIELGESSATFVQGDWYAVPDPVVRIAEPSAEHAAEKRAFETDRLTAWFGA